MLFCFFLKFLIKISHLLMFYNNIHILCSFMYQLTVFLTTINIFIIYDQQLIQIYTHNATNNSQKLLQFCCSCLLFFETGLHNIAAVIHNTLYLNGRERFQGSAVFVVLFSHCLAPCSVPKNFNSVFYKGIKQCYIVKWQWLIERAEFG